MMKTNFHMVVPRTKESDVIWTFLTDMIVKIHLSVPNKSPLVFANGLNDIWAHVPVNDSINTKLIEWTDGIANSKFISAITILSNFLNNQISCLFSYLTKVLLAQGFDLNRDSKVSTLNRLLYFGVEITWFLFKWFHGQFSLSELNKLFLTFFCKIFSNK